MRALRFNQFGDPAVLHLSELPDPVGTAQDAVIRVEAASVNPSDVKNVAGLMDWTVLPRTPGRDFAGVVVSGPPEWQGAVVWGTGGDTGFTRDGSHAEFISIPVDALVRKPERLSFDEASTVGVNFVVGWYGAVGDGAAGRRRNDCDLRYLGGSGRCGRADRSCRRRQGNWRGSPPRPAKTRPPRPSSITSSPSTLPPMSVRRSNGSPVASVSRWSMTRSAGSPPRQRWVRSRRAAGWW